MEKNVQLKIQEEKMSKSKFNSGPLKQKKNEKVKVN